MFQPSNLAANSPFADAATVFDYGYRRIFTPDYRGTSNETPAKDIALESVSDLFAVSAVTTGHPHVTVCGWAIDVAAGDAQKNLCTQVDFNDLPLGPANVPATALDVVRASTLEAEGDYLVGRLDADDQWSVQLWRVGSK